MTYATYPSQHSGKPLHPNTKVRSRRRASILDRHVADLLGLLHTRRELKLQLGVRAGSGPCQVLRRQSASPEPWCVAAQTGSEYRITALCFCFIFSSEALSCFIRWDTTGADQVGVREGEEIQEKIPTCLEVRLHSQARVPAPPSGLAKLQDPETGTKSNRV